MLLFLDSSYTTKITSVCSSFENVNQEALIKRKYFNVVSNPILLHMPKYEAGKSYLINRVPNLKKFKVNYKNNSCN